MGETMANQTTLTTLTNRDWKPVFAGLAGLGFNRAQEDIQGSILPNVILCSEGGYRAKFHEFLLRKDTTIFDVFKSAEDLGASFCDLFGNYVFILAGVGREAIQGLAALLYRGKCDVSTRRSYEALRGLLKPELSGQVFLNGSGSASSVAPQAVIPHDCSVRLERMDVDASYMMSQQAEEVSSQEVLPVIQEVESLASTATAASSVAPQVVITRDCFVRLERIDVDSFVISQQGDEASPVIGEDMSLAKSTTPTREQAETAAEASEHTQAGENPFSCTQCEYQGRSSNHLKGHIERVHAVSTGWRPSGSGVVAKTKAGNPRIRRRLACGKCPGCKRSDCSKCINCLDKPKYGGENTRKQKCIKRKCQNAHKELRDISNNIARAEEAVEEATSKQFSCSHCDYKTSEPNMLKTHELIHTEWLPM